MVIVTECINGSGVFCSVRSTMNNRCWSWLRWNWLLYWRRG